MSVLETHAVPMSLMEKWKTDDAERCYSYAAWALRNEIDVVFVVDTEHPEAQPLAIIETVP